MMRLPAIVIVSFYFSRHRALATSVVLCGSGVGELVFAPLSRYLIDKYGWRGANCILGAIVLHGAVCGCVFRPVSRGSERRSRPSPQPPRHETSGCVIMQKIIAEKRRRRCESTGSLDNMMITSDGRLLSPVSAGRSRTVSELLEQYSPVDEPSLSIVESGQPTVRTRTVSDSVPVDTSLRTLSRHDSSADQLGSTRPLQPVLADNCESLTTPVPSAEVVQERSSTPPEVSESDPNTVVWLRHNSSSTALNSSCIEQFESSRCSNNIEMTDLPQDRAPSSVHGPRGMSIGPPSVLAPLSSRPDIFYTGSCLQVCLVHFLLMIL